MCEASGTSRSTCLFLTGTGACAAPVAVPSMHSVHAVGRKYDGNSLITFLWILFRRRNQTWNEGQG
ncbi:hypothetical protein ANT2_4010 [plant metagenome]|uniref:Uncharacterized protein n=1 Tax=plant metagenome TaxID=1297885 RepID=A0A484SRR7_9ZZZZ